MPVTAQPYAPPDNEAIHDYFGLSYKNYLVLQRTLLQSMPGWWQERFVALLNDLEEAFGHIEMPPAYKVEAADEVEVGSLTDAQLELLGISRREVDCTVDHDHETGSRDCSDHVLYDSAAETDMAADHLVLFPARDPVPHYNRGRSRVEPNLEPRCDEIILELQWPGIAAGDLVLHGGRWVRLEQALPGGFGGELAITVLYGGETSVHQVHAADVTCVKRYAER